MVKKTKAEIYAERLEAKYGPNWKEIFREAGRKAATVRNGGFTKNSELAREAGRKGRRVAVERHGEELFAKAREKAWETNRKKSSEKNTRAGHTVSDGDSTEG